VDVGVEPGKRKAVRDEGEGFGAGPGKGQFKSGFLKSGGNDFAKGCIFLDNEDRWPTQIR
jgi:hypothetical protein